MTEMSNSITGLSPYYLAFGRPARGPLAILKENLKPGQVHCNISGPVEE